MKKPTILFTPLAPDEIREFASKVSAPSGNPIYCWRWRGGYSGKIPLFRLRGRYVSATRLAYFLRNPDFDQSSMVRRRCISSGCINPSHYEHTID